MRFRGKSVTVDRTKCTKKWGWELLMMTLTLDDNLAARLKEQAEAVGLTMEAYIERIVDADEGACQEIEALALEGLDSGPPIKADESFWQERQRVLEEATRLS